MDEEDHARFVELKLLHGVHLTVTDSKLVVYGCIPQDWGPPQTFIGPLEAFHHEYKVDYIAGRFRHLLTVSRCFGCGGAGVQWRPSCWAPKLGKYLWREDTRACPHCERHRTDDRREKDGEDYQVSEDPRFPCCSAIADSPFDASRHRTNCLYAYQRKCRSAIELFQAGGVLDWAGNLTDTFKIELLGAPYLKKGQFNDNGEPVIDQNAYASMSLTLGKSLWWPPQGAKLVLRPEPHLEPLPRPRPPKQAA